jgi:tetratricopeptide (TPR) repeat protein
MKTLFRFIVLLFFLNVYTQDNIQRITGVVTNSKSPLSGVSISVKGTPNGVQTNENGEYTIYAKPEEKLIYNHLGMKTVKVLVEDVTRILNIRMVPNVNQLDEVVVKKYRRKTALERQLEFNYNKDLIRTSTGILDKRKSALSMTIIDGEDLTRGSPTFLEAIRGKFVGDISYKGSIFDEEGTLVYLRTTTSLLGGQKAAIYDVDGVIMGAPPLFLAVQEIDRIAVIRGIGASGRYGRRGHGGVIVINTKRGKYTNPKLTQKFKDSIKLSKKRVVEAFSAVDWNSETSTSLKYLYDCDSEKKAIQVFETKKEKFMESPYDAIQVGNYFMSEWQNREKAEEIWNSIRKKHSNNAVILKALAYTYEKNEDLTVAMQIYQAISSIRPNHLQSFRDLANINSELGKHKKALTLYARPILNRIEVPQNGIDSIINIESHNLLTLNKMELSSKVEDIEQVLGYSPIRVLLEWNNGEAEFDLQCMNPPNYYTWKHSFESNPKRIEDEKIRGYSSKQFFLNEELGGKWQFNLKYFGNKSFEPTYLKATIYFDYGKPSQRKELKVFRLQKENLNMHLMTIDLDSKSISS